MTKQKEISFEVLDTKITNIQQDVSEIKDKLERDYVTRQEFLPIQRLVYGLVTLILTGVVGALLALVIVK